MKRAFHVVLAFDVLLLLLPTGGLGPWVEFGIAVTLAAVTTVCWVWLNLSRGDGGAEP